MRRQAKTSEDKQGQRSVHVCIYEYGRAGRSHRQSFSAVSAHKMKMSSIVEGDRFIDSDGFAGVVFIRDDGVATVSMYRSVPDADTILKAFAEAMVLGEPLVLGQAADPPEPDLDFNED